MSWRALRGAGGPVLGLVFVSLIFGILIGTQFFLPGNLELIARQTAIVAAAALGMTIIIVSGGIDLSVGSVVALTTVVIAVSLNQGWPPLAAAVAGVLAGAACGAINGALITALRVVPFIVTLGTMILVRGAAKGVADERRIEAPQTWLNELLRSTAPGDAVLLFATGQWMRIVPTSWDVFPNALSAALQYASLDWPTENGWINYNALQLLTYFITVFIAAPLAFITGLLMSSAWPKKAAGLNKAYPIEWARAVHFPVMIYFVAFIVVHVFLVLATGALRNLNHMYGVRDDDGWFGFWVFVASVAVMVAAWFLARPLFLRPIASLMGKVSNR